MSCSWFSELGANIPTKPKTVPSGAVFCVCLSCFSQSHTQKSRFGLQIRNGSLDIVSLSGASQNANDYLVSDYAPGFSLFVSHYVPL